MKRIEEKIIVIGIAFTVSLLWPSLSFAGLVPLGGEFQINTTTTGDQQSFSVGTDDAGNFTAAWTSPVSQTCDVQDIFFQLFDSNGNKTGAEITGPEYLDEGQNNPNLAMDSNGNFVIVWYEGTDISVGPCPATNADGNCSGIYVQRYLANGTPNGSVIQVNTSFIGCQKDPVVAMNGLGDFVVAWLQPNDGDSQGVYAQLFDSDGNKIGSEQVVNQTIVGNQWDFDVSINDSSQWIAVWRSPDGDQDGVFARRFDSTGNPIEGEWRVNQNNSGLQYNPAVKLFNNSTFVVSWTHWITDGDSYFQRFEFDGTRIGVETLAHQVSSTMQANKDIDGNNITHSFIIVWQNSDSSNYGVEARLFNWAGFPEMGQIQVNTTQINYQRLENRNIIALSSSGMATIVWRDDSADSNGYGGFGERYQVTSESGIPVLSPTILLVMLIMFSVVLIYTVRRRKPNFNL